jgi:hypothetical protein
MDAANAIYIGLGKRELTREIRLDVLRNHALLLYDWKQAGKAGDYLDDAHRMLREYVRLGGVIDERLAPTWNDLEERARR